MSRTPLPYVTSGYCIAWHRCTGKDKGIDGLFQGDKENDGMECPWGTVGAQQSDT